MGLPATPLTEDAICEAAAERTTLYVIEGGAATAAEEGLGALLLRLLGTAVEAPFVIVTVLLWSSPAGEGSDFPERKWPKKPPPAPPATPLEQCVEPSPPEIRMSAKQPSSTPAPAAPPASPPAAPSAALPSPKAVQQCEAAPEEVPCFNVPAGADKDEFARQLKEQQDELNKMSPEEYEARRNAYDKGNRDRQAQQRERESYQAKKMMEYFEENITKGMDPEAALKAAEEKVEAEMRKLDATHALDMVAGGDPSDISGLGDRSINRSIGSQWKDRVEKLDEIAEKSKKDGKDKLNVELKPCD
jgi:hypothetical protein